MIDRKQLMEYLPQNAICAEVGVAKGKFTWQIFVSMFTLESATLANVVSLAFSLGITL